MRFRLTFIVLLMLLFWWPSQGHSQQTLVIATSEHPPLVSANPAESFLGAVLTEIGRQMGVTFELKFLPWKRCEPAIESLEAWGGMPFISTPERKEKFLFSDALYVRKTKFFYYSPDGTEKHIQYETLNDLKGYRIGAVRGYYYEKALLDAGIEVEFVTSEELNWEKLRAGRVDLIVSPEYNGIYLLKKLFHNEDNNFFSLSKSLDFAEAYMVSSKQYPDAQNLMNKFNAALQMIKENGAYQKLLDKYVTMRE